MLASSALRVRLRSSLLPWAGSAGMLIGAGVVLAGILALDLRGALISSGLPDEVWKAPPYSAYTFVPAVSGGVAGLLALAALALRYRPRATAAVATLAALCPAAASIVLSTQPQERYGYWFAAVEMVAVVLAVTVVIVRGGPAAAVPAVLAAYLTILSGAWRDLPGLDQVGWIGHLGRSVQPCLMLLLPGCYLRWRQARQRSQIEQARREERLAISRELHDIVAHQITGIVVQVQALRHAQAGTDPGLTRAALPGIEDAGAQALAAMRGMVAALRDPDDVAPAPRDTAAALAALERPGDQGQPRVEVALAGALAELPPETGAAVARIAQEGVTNALRHARDATRILVRAEVGAAAVRVEVVDNGRGGIAMRGERPGYGLVGMRERARLLGGSCTVAPASDGSGWRLRADLPLPAEARGRADAPPAAGSQGGEEGAR